MLGWGSLVCVGANTLGIRPIQMRTIHNIRLIRTVVSHTFYLDVSKVVEAVQKTLHGNYTHVGCDNIVREECKKQIEATLEHLRRVTSARPRYKRALAPVIGEILHLLTGVATEKTIDPLRRRIQDMEEDIGMEGRQLMQVENAIEILTNLTESIEEQQKAIMYSWKLHREVCNKYDGHLRSATYTLSQLVATLIEAVYLLPEGSPNLLKAEMLEEVIKETLHRVGNGLELPVARISTYDLPLFSAHFVEGVFTYKLSLPLTTPTMFTKFKIRARPFLHVNKGGVALRRLKISSQELIVSQDLQSIVKLQSDECLIVKNHHLCLSTSPGIINEPTGCMRTLLHLEKPLECEIEAWPTSLELPYIVIFNESHLYTLASQATTLLPLCQEGRIEALKIPEGTQVIPIPECKWFKGLEVMQIKELTGESIKLPLPEIVKYRLQAPVRIPEKQASTTHRLIPLRGFRMMARKTSDGESNRWPSWMVWVGVGAIVMLGIIVTVLMYLKCRKSFRSSRVVILSSEIKSISCEKQNPRKSRVDKDTGRYTQKAVCTGRIRRNE